MPKISSQEGSHLGSMWNLALRLYFGSGLHFGSDGVHCRAAWVAENLAYWPTACEGSMVWVQWCCYSLSRLSSSLLGYPLHPDRIQVPHHHP